MSAAIRVTRVASRQELEKAFSIRLRVFVREQGVPKEIELDDDDASAAHFLALLGESAVGTARLAMHGNNAKIGRMAVLRHYRRKGVGRELLKRAVKLAQRRKAKTIFLNAQVSAIGFYERLGFSCVGPVFDEAGIPHRKMVLE